jgi:hypothetical protein
VQQVGIRMSSKRPTQLDCLRELHTRTATSASLQRKHGKLPHQQPVKEYVNCVSMSVYGLDWQSRRSKSCVVNDGSLSTEVLRVAVGCRGTRSKTLRFMFRSKEWREEAADRRAKGQGRVQPCPLLTAFSSSVITAAQSYASSFASQQVNGP